MKGTKKMKKKVYAILLSSVVLISACSSDNTDSKTQEVSNSSGDTIPTQQEQKNIGELLNVSENEEVKLYVSEEDEEGYMGVTLEINGNQKGFDWDIPKVGTGEPPQLIYTDLTGDGEEEAVVIINTARGTELSEFDIHVIDAEYFSLLKVPTYEDISKEIASNVTKNDDGKLSIQVKTQGEEITLNHNLNPEQQIPQDELEFGGVVTYYVEEQKIKLHLPGSVGAYPTYVADFTITFKYDNSKNEFVINNIDVKPIES